MLTRKAATNEEDRRQHDAHGAKLLQLRVEKGMALLIIAAVGAAPAIALQQVVEPRDHVRLGRAEPSAAA